MGVEAAALDTTATMLKAQSSLGAKSAKDLMSAQDLKDLKKVEATAKEFEAVFATEMLKPMFEGLKTDGMFDGGKGEEIFRGMMLDQYGKKIAETGCLGIADHVKEELLRIQEHKRA